jgi:hypothetical protein
MAQRIGLETAMAKWMDRLACWLYGHDPKTTEVWWGGIDYERITRCRRCGKRFTDREVVKHD